MNFKYIACVITALALLPASTMADDEAAAEREALAKRLAPVGQLCLEGQTCTSAEELLAEVDDSPTAVEDPSVAEVPEHDGEALYAQASCGACHAAGIAGAPATGDSAAWTARLTKGKGELYANAINGLGAMPPKGGRFNFSDDEIKAIVDYMISEVE
ncbi:c-type cytochrome [Halomonas sp. AOP43-A1-21]